MYEYGIKIVGEISTSFTVTNPDGETETIGGNPNTYLTKTIRRSDSSQFTYKYKFKDCSFEENGYITSNKIVPEVGDEYLKNICQKKYFPKLLEKTYLNVQNDIENKDVKFYNEEKKEFAKGQISSWISTKEYFTADYYIKSSLCTDYVKIRTFRSYANEDYVEHITDNDVPAKCVEKPPSQTYYLKIKNSLSESYKLFALRSGSYVEIQRGTTKTFNDTSTFTMNLYITSSKCPEYTFVGIHQASTSSSDVDVIDDNRVPDKCVDNSPPSQTYYLKIKNSLSESYKLFALRSGSYVEIQRGTTKTFNDTSTFTMNLYITSSKCPEYTFVGIHQASTSSSDVDVIDDNRVPDKCVVTDEDESSKILKYTLSSTVNNIRRPIQIHIVKEAADGCIPSKNSPLESLSSSKDNSLEKSGTSNNRKNSKNSPNVMLIVGFVAAMAAIVAIVVIYKKNAGKSSQ